MSTEQDATRSDMEKVVARAIADEGFRKRLGEDPEGTVRAEGYSLSADEMAAIKQNVDPDLSQEQLEERVSKAYVPFNNDLYKYQRPGSATGLRPPR